MTNERKFLRHTHAGFILYRCNNFEIINKVRIKYDLIPKFNLLYHN